MDTNSIRVALNGTDVTACSSFIATEAGVTFNFLSPTLLAALSTNTLSVVFNDNGTPQFVSSNFWTFKIAPYGPYARDLVKGYLGMFQGTSLFTRAGDGHTGAANDRALDITPAGSLGARMVDPPFLTDVNRGAGRDTLSVSFWINQTAIGNSAFWFTSASAGGGRGFQAH